MINYPNEQNYDKKDIYHLNPYGIDCQHSFLPQDRGGNPHAIEPDGLQVAFGAIPINMEFDEHQLCNVGSGRKGVVIGKG